MMAFIPCTTGTVALYDLPGGALEAVLVEAWDETGAPYIAEQSGLINATTQPEFVRLENASAIVPPPALPPTVVQVLRGPAGRGTRPPRERDLGSPPDVLPPGRA
jgi:hypothetical protein